MAIAVAKAVMMNGAATKNHATGVNSTPQRVSNTTTVAKPNNVLITRVTHIPKDASRPN
jgi:hypothetical protein